jgi:hypothetical protein
MTLPLLLLLAVGVRVAVQVDIVAGGQVAQGAVDAVMSAR